MWSRIILYSPRLVLCNLVQISYLFSHSQTWWSSPITCSGYLVLQPRNQNVDWVPPAETWLLCRIWLIRIIIKCRNYNSWTEQGKYLNWIWRNKGQLEKYNQSLLFMHHDGHCCFAVSLGEFWNCVIISKSNQDRTTDRVRVGRSG